MLIVIVLLSLGLVLLLPAMFSLMRTDKRAVSGFSAVKWSLLASFVMFLGGLGCVIAINVQEKTGIETGMSGGAESDARQWLAKNKGQMPAADQPGDNIRVLREGLAFIRGHRAIASSTEGQQVLQQYSSLPERPTKLLTRQDELQYYEGAQAVWRLISGYAGTNDN